MLLKGTLDRMVAGGCDECGGMISFKSYCIQRKYNKPHLCFKCHEKLSTT